MASKRYIIYVNSTPHQLLPAGWTKAQAEAMCAQLNEPFKGAVFESPYWFQSVIESGELRRSEKEYD